jgi:hypothetical protein
MAQRFMLAAGTWILAVAMSSCSGGMSQSQFSLSSSGQALRANPIESSAVGPNTNYGWFSHVFTIMARSQRRVTFKCPNGVPLVVNGAFKFASYTTAFASYPSTNFTGWTALFNNDGYQTEPVTFYIYCTQRA